MDVLKIKGVRERVRPLLGPGEHARFMVLATGGATAWDGPAPAAYAPPGTDASGDPAGAVPPGDAPAGARVAGALAEARRQLRSLLVTDQRLLVLRVESGQRRGSDMAFEALLGIPLQEVVSVVPLGSRWFQLSGRTWRVRLGFADASSVVVDVGRKGNVTLLAGALTGGRGVG